MDGEFEASCCLIDSRLEDARVVRGYTKPYLVSMNRSNEAIGIKMCFDLGQLCLQQLLEKGASRVGVRLLTPY